METVKRKAVYFDGSTNNYFGKACNKLCDALNDLAGTLKQKHYLKVATDLDFLKDVVDRDFDRIIDAYMKGLTDNLETCNPILMDTAIDTVNQKRAELSKILTDAREKMDEFFNWRTFHYGGITDALRCVKYDETAKAFVTDAEAVKEHATTFAEGEKAIKLHERMEKVLKEIEDLNKECGEYRLVFLNDGSAGVNAVAYIDYTGKTKTNYYYFNSIK